jgi:hypothetical protein
MGTTAWAAALARRVAVMAEARARRAAVRARRVLAAELEPELAAQLGLRARLEQRAQPERRVRPEQPARPEQRALEVATTRTPAHRTPAVSRF